jgi:type II secretory pathway pseudopilin PulG
MFSPKRFMKPVSNGLAAVELIILLAIFAILAAIAVPNFLEAQLRAKVAQLQSDMRALATSIETYNVDFKDYPPVSEENQFPLSARLQVLTTPIAYITQLPADVFPDLKNSAFPEGAVDTYYYDREVTLTAEGDKTTSSTQGWRLVSAGPDQQFEYGKEIFDVTNGTLSRGDIMRTGGVLPKKPATVVGMANTGQSDAASGKP